MLRSARLLLVSFLLPLSLFAQPSEPLTVGLREAAPFAYQEAGEWTGLAVDLWEEMAEAEGLAFEYQVYPLAELLDAVEAGEVDVAVAALTMTPEREERFDFTYPFQNAGLAIAAQATPSGWGAAIRQFVSLEFLQAVLALAAVVFVFGLLVWLFERKKNEMFGGSTLKGLGSGFWWSAVTMTTVGYGDKAPVTIAGRVVGLVWMFAAIIIISGFTAAIASSLTVGSLQSSIEDLDDLRGAKVAILEGAASGTFLRDRRVRFETTPTLAAVLRAVEAGDLDAIVHDAPILRYEIQRLGLREVRVLPEEIDPQSYAFALPSGSPLRESLNQALLATIQGPAWADRVASYLGD